MMKNLAPLFLVFFAVAVTGCGEENLERADFNTYFFPPDNEEEVYLGLFHGLSSCQSAAYAKANSLNMSRSSGWSYICCKKTSSSNCQSKHK
jgi:hypothetical protein